MHPRARKLIREGLRDDNNWRLGLGAAIAAAGVVRRATTKKSEMVQRVVVGPGEALVISTATPVHTSRKARKRANAAAKKSAKKNRRR